MKQKIKKNSNHAVGYCRFSSDNQSESSIEAQKIAIEKFAKEQGIIIVEWYIDRAQSGTTDNRKRFREMIDDSAEKDFCKVLVYQFDRFARNKDDSFFYKFDLRKNGVKVISITERIEDSPEGRMMETVLEGMADYYSKDLARKTIRGMTLNASKGLNNGGTVPYGYKLVPRLDENNNVMHHNKGHELHCLAIHPERAEAVKIMYAMTLEGKKRFEIIDRLNELGYKRADGNEFVGTSIDNILRNEKYTGVYVYDCNKRKRQEDASCEAQIIRVPDALPQIISKETFDAVQQILRQRVKAPSVCNEDYLLSGKIICGECGKLYSGARQKKGGKYYPYYKCNKQHTYKNGMHLTEHCRNNTVQRYKIEGYVLKQVAKILADERNIDKVLDEYNRFAAEMKDNSELIEMYEKQIKDADKQILNLVNIIATTGNFSETLQMKLDSLEAEKKRLEAVILQEKKSCCYLSATKDELRQVYKKAQEQLLSGTFEEQKAVLHLFLNKVVIYKEFVEIFVNLIPISHLGGIDVNITPQEMIAENRENTLETLANTGNTEENTQKDGQNPSFSYSHIYSENDYGSSGRI